MDPTSFTQTSFCGSTVDNITENEAKQYILNQMSIKCSGITYQSRYAKVYNEQYKKNLNNPHILCLKSSGTPYLLFLTQINETNYTFLIDKKVKDGYEYPKIFILPYYWSPELYEGTLFECELIRDRHKRWSIGIGDVYYAKGKNMSNTVIIDRINTIHEILTDFKESEFCKTCFPFVKRYFDYKEFEDIVTKFVPTLTYDIRGVYFVPMRCSYSKIIFLLPRDNPMNQRHNQIQNHNHNQNHNQVQNQVQGHNQNQNQNQVQDASVKLLRLMKTMKPDVYEVYSEDNDALKKLGLALVQTKECSQKLCDAFQDKSQTDEVRLPCRYNSRFHKWCPV